MTMRAPRAVGLLGLLLLAPPLLARAVSAMSIPERPPEPKAAEGRGLTTAVTGEVVDERGAPVADAEVEAVITGSIAVPHRVRTDAKGRFAIPGLREGWIHVLRASHRGLAPESLAIILFGKPRYRLTLHPGATAFGTVVDEAGQPVAGARVELVGKESPPHSYRSISGADGSFRISDLPATVLELRVAHRGFPLLTRAGIASSRGARIDLGRLALPAGKRFQGKVLDVQGGRPLAGARVFAVYEGDSPFLLGASGDSGPEPEAITGPDGGFEVPRIGPGTSFYVCLPDYQYSFISFALPPSEPWRFELARTLPRPRISSRVLDEAGRPVAGARITLGDPEYLERDRTALAPCGKGGPDEWTTDAAGRFAFDPPEAGEVELWVRAPGYVRETRKVTKDQMDEVDVVLRHGATVTGRVFTPDGSPAPGARVYAVQEGGAAETVADAQGRYRLVAVEPGWRQLWADHPSLGEARRRLELAPGTRRLDLTLDGRREPAIAGRVVGPDGKPLARVRVGDESSSAAETGEDGAFRIAFPRGRLLFADETGTLRFDREGYAATFYPFKSSTLPLEGLEIRMEKSRALTALETPPAVGDRPSDGLEIRLKPSLALRGRILGMPEGASVSLAFTRDGHSIEASVDPDGTYRCTGLGPGEWQVEASLDAQELHRRRKIQVTLSPAGLPDEVFNIDLSLGDLTLAGRLTSGEEPLSTTVTLLMPDGQPLSEDVIVEETNGAAFRFPGLRAGRYLLRIEDYYRDRRIDVPVDLTSDREMTIDLLRSSD
jgi:protocatechuate 3,4-dioxygenase beta subunit